MSEELGCFEFEVRGQASARGHHVGPPSVTCWAGLSLGWIGMGRDGMGWGGVGTAYDRMTRAGHKFSSTIHCLVRAVQKLQRLTSGVQGTWLY